ncbi:hypothetical protein HAZT_HAZT008723 [Hyalella azteca]|uniref:Ubiquitinyl hydrolase 1 n=1 Tax=Hyalella azteca TaxID=294128 RepID=A0A6A0GWP2_HYAAZ|nr:hypothetical protein HAZT_HAZT008723 [Hyalella azteca]
MTGDWFCFNDQSVTRIGDEEIKRTYGGGGRTGGSYGASANAYMLMYRQCNEDRNLMPFTKDNFPAHIQKLCENLMIEEELEKELREREKSTCVIRLFCHHPAAAQLTGIKLHVNKNSTLAEATELAHEQLGLQKHVPLERCRLVKYEEYHDSIESSFEGQEDKPFSEIVGGVKSSYKFDLLLEVRDEHQQFEAYQPGSVSFKVFVVSLDGQGEVEGPFITRGLLSMTVAELKKAIASTLNLKSETMRIASEGFYEEMKFLSDDAALLRTEGFYKSNKLFVEASGEESTNFYMGSQMASIIERYHNTITLYCTLPVVTPDILAELNIPPFVEDKSTSTCETSFAVQAQEPEASEPQMESLDAVAVSVPGGAKMMSLDVGPRLAIASNVIIIIRCASCTSLTDVPSAPAAAEVCAAVSNLSDDEDGADVCGGPHSALSSDQSTSEDSSLTSDSDRTLVGDPPDDERLSEGGHSPDYHNVSSPEENNGSTKDASTWSGGASCWASEETAAGRGWWQDEDAVIKRYFKAEFLPDENDQKVLQIRVDKRMTVDQLKLELQPYVGVGVQHFKLYKKFIQEFECNRGGEQLNFGDCCKLGVKLDRALQVGEFRGKVYLLDLTNNEEPAKFLIEFVMRENDTVSQAKAAILAEVKARLGLELKFEDELKGPEPKMCEDDLVLFIRRWRPSVYQVDPIEEIVLPIQTAEALRETLGRLSGISSENVEFARGTGPFPHNLSVFDISTKLSWVSGSGPLEDKPYNLLYDGVLVYYRDKDEQLGVLSDSERSEVEAADNKRLNKDSPYPAAALPSKPAREKGLKIYFKND